MQPAPVIASYTSQDTIAEECLIGCLTYYLKAALWQSSDSENHLHQTLHCSDTHSYLLSVSVHELL